MSKKSNSKAPVPAKSSSPASPNRKYIRWGILALALAAIAYFVWSKYGKSTPSFAGENVVEPTLNAKNPRLQLLSAAETGIDFQNQILEDEKHNVIRYVNQYNGGGVAIADINNDNLPDIYFICTNGKNKLYLNQGNFKF